MKIIMEKLSFVKIERTFPSKFNDYRLTKTFCDVTVKVEDRLFPAHKMILVEASPFFEGMFLGSVGYEKKSEEIKLRDIKPDIFDLIVEFIYTGQAKITSENLFDILLAAHMYELKDLERETAKLERSITVQNAVEVYHLASKLSIKSLETKASEGIALHIDTISNPEQIPGELVQVLSKNYKVKESQLANIFKKWTEAKEPKAKRWNPLIIFEKKDENKLLFESAEKIRQGLATEDERCIFLSNIFVSLNEAKGETAEFSPVKATGSENAGSMDQWGCNDEYEDNRFYRHGNDGNTNWACCGDVDSWEDEGHIRAYSHEIEDADWRG